MVDLSDDSSWSGDNLDAEMEQPDPETLEDFYVDEDRDHWLSEDHLFELQTAKDKALKAPPPLVSWKLRKPTTNTDLTVAKARQLAWEQGKMELNLHQRNVSNLPPLSSHPILTPSERVYQYLFGSTSRLCRLFQDKLELSTEQYIRFLITYMKSCCYKMSVKNLHATDDDIKLILSTEDYNGIRRKIASLPRHAHGESFWQEVERLMNEAFKVLFMAAKEPFSADTIDQEKPLYLCHWLGR